MLGDLPFLPIPNLEGLILPVGSAKKDLSNNPLAPCF